MSSFSSFKAECVSLRGGSITEVFQLNFYNKHWSNILPLESKMVLGFQPVSSYILIRLQTLKKFNIHHLNLE